MGKRDERQVPAIVMGRGPTSLGILHCLKLAGVPTYVARRAGEQVTRSRWFRPTPGPPTRDGVPGPQTLEHLRHLPLDVEVLIAGADDAALWLADLPQSVLGQRFRASTCSPQTQGMLQDKSLGRAARRNRHGAPADLPHRQRGGHRGDAFRAA